MNDHHHHGASIGRRLSSADFIRRFGEGAGSTDVGPGFVLEPAGRRRLDELRSVVRYQWDSDNPDGLVHGFILSGPPGTGKTSLAYALGYQLSRLYPEGGPGDQDSVATVYIDGGDLARAKYGESEQRIRDLFRHANAGFDFPGQRSLIVLDDVDSIFMDRSSSVAREWHFAQDSVFFHSIDAMDTRRVAVVLTTNRPDLVDAAILDRFVLIDVPAPSLELIRLVAAAVSAHYSPSPEFSDSFVDAISAAYDKGKVSSLRDVRSAFLMHFISHAVDSYQ